MRCKFMEDDSDPHLVRGSLLLVVLLLTLTFVQPVSASIGAYNVQYGDGYVSAKARCSCGVSGYNYGTGTFKDYCPNCKHYNCLYFEQGAYYGYNKGTSPEGLWACKYCDMDYCAKCGKSHDNRNIWLIRTSKPKPKPVEVKPAEPEHFITKDPFGREVKIEMKVIKDLPKSL